MNLKVLLLASACLVGCTEAPEDVEQEDASFAIGYELGRGLATSGWQELDQQALWAGVQAGLAGEPAASERAGVAFAALQARGQARLEAESVAARTAGAQYLEEYLEQPEHRLSTLGVGFVVQKQGTGSLAELDQELLVSYRLETLEGQLIESVAADTPLVLRFGQMIPAWEEALRQMRVGEVRELIVPPDAGYGDRRIDTRIPAGATLRFVVHLAGLR